MVKKAKIIRKSIGVQLEEARAAGRVEGFRSGFDEGAASGRREFMPPYESRDGLRGFIGAVDAWPIEDNAVVVVIATDCKVICNLNVQAGLMKMIAREMKKRLG